VPGTVGPDQPGPPSTGVGQPESPGPQPPSSPDDPEPDEVPDDEPEEPPDDDPVPEEDVDEVPDDVPLPDPPDDVPDVPDPPEDPDEPEEPDEAPEEPPDAAAPPLEPVGDPGGSDAVVPHASEHATIAARAAEGIDGIREMVCMFLGAPVVSAKLSEDGPSYTPLSPRRRIVLDAREATKRSPP
jgi:hypothetical protein